MDKIIKLSVAGMTCYSCELTIERAWRKIDGVLKVDVNAGKGVARVVCNNTTPSIEMLQSAIADHGYTVRGVLGATTPSVDQKTLGIGRLPWLHLAGLFALVIVLGSLFSKLGLLRPNVAFGSGATFGAIFLMGLIAASSSCIAIAGGLLLSSAAKFNERYASATPLARMRPVALFIAGRLASYALFGGLIGALGRALSPSPLVTGAITIIAALAMLIMGLDMLHLAPQWIKHLMPRIPKIFAHKAMSIEGKDHPMIPFGLGTATFFLPCGFTQALQLYALTTGSFATGAFLLFAFALGTAPSLLALGWVGGALKGKFGRFFFQFSGALVVMLGFWNLQNGFTIAGYPVTFQRVTHLFASESEASSAFDPNVRFDGQTQTVNMSIAYTGYEPNRFTIRQGVPTRWVIDAKSGGGCLAVLQAPALGIRTFLQPGINTIEFTPRVASRIPFSCSMGMFRGEITVIASSG